MEVVADQRPYAEMRHDPDLLAAYRRNAEALGRKLLDDDGGRRMPVSTDMGNISRALPSIHPSISIDSLPAVNHQAEFTAHCVSPAAEQALFDGAVAMAWTATDAASDERLRARLLAPEG
jgi:metal-dependent amidase/aminoacylase/carboxypeptidase family protein